MGISGIPGTPGETADRSILQYNSLIFLTAGTVAEQNRAVTVEIDGAIAVTAVRLFFKSKMILPGTAVITAECHYIGSSAPTARLRDHSVSG